MSKRQRPGRIRPAGGGAATPHTLIHRNKGPNPVSMRVSGQVGPSYPQVEEVFRECMERGASEPFSASAVDFFSVLPGAVAFAIGVAFRHGEVVGTFPVPTMVAARLGLGSGGALEVWAVGREAAVLGLFASVVASEGGADDVARH